VRELLPDLGSALILSGAAHTPAPRTADITDQFYAAIRTGDAGAVQKLICNGADVNMRDCGTALFYTAGAGTRESCAC
jgi:hypothetical protein